MLVRWDETKPCGAQNKNPQSQTIIHLRKAAYDKGETRAQAGAYSGAIMNPASILAAHIYDKDLGNLDMWKVRRRVATPGPARYHHHTPPASPPAAAAPGPAGGRRYAPLGLSSRGCRRIVARGSKRGWRGRALGFGRSWRLRRTCTLVTRRGFPVV